MLILLFAIGLFAGAIDAVAGGGGLITLPVLLGIGMPPHLAFGTNKLQGSIGTFFAARKYYQHGLISFNTIYKGIIFGITGSIAGAMCVQVLSGDMLRVIIPILLTGILLYTIFSPSLGSHEVEPKFEEKWFFILFGFGLGFYDGFFGPGTGSFWVFCLVFFLGYKLIKATAYTKVFNLNSSIVATVCFAVNGNIDYRVALTMAAGQIIGAKLGAHLAIKKDAQLIRPVFLAVVFSTIVFLMYKTYSTSTWVAHWIEQYGRVPPILLATFFLVSLAVIYWRKAKERS